MNIFAYCTLPARDAVHKATGVEPITSPPMVAHEFDPKELQDRDLIYIRLHGFEDIGDTWFGEDLRGPRLPASLRAAAIKPWPALTREHLNGIDLGGAAVVLANCHGATSPMVPALYRAGAQAVVAGPGPNLAAGDQVVGTDTLVRWIILAVRCGLSIRRAVRVAKIRLATTAWRVSDRDALGFKIMEV